jgi:hypothetical protein
VRRDYRRAVSRRIAQKGRLPVSLAARQMRTYAFKLSDVR